MNVSIAQQISSRVSKIAELSAIFNAKYGCNYRLNPESPTEAWDLYHQLMAEQAQIASLLDNEAVSKPYVRFERWWERRDVINTALVNEMASETIRLVERAAYLMAVEHDQNAQSSLRVIQEGIAGLLHPATRQQAIERHN